MQLHSAATILMTCITDESGRFHDKTAVVPRARCSHDLLAAIRDSLLGCPEILSLSLGFPLASVSQIVALHDASRDEYDFIKLPKGPPPLINDLFNLRVCRQYMFELT